MPTLASARRSRRARTRRLARGLAVLAIGTLACPAADEPRDVRAPRTPVRSAVWVDSLNAGVRVLHAAPGLGAGRDRARVRVAWSNRTERDYPNSLELQCIARRPDGRFVSSGSANFFPGPRRILPDFHGELELELPLGGERFGSVSCSVVEAR